MKKNIFLFLSLLIPSFLHSASLSERVADAMEKIESKLPFLRAAAEDLAIPARWPVAHAIPAVENLMEKPLEGPRQITKWIESVQKSGTPSQIFAVAKDVLGAGGPDLTVQASTDPVQKILLGLEKALPHLRASYSNLSLKERNDILRVHDYPADQTPGESPRQPSFKRKAFKSLEKFKEEELLSAASVILEIIDKEFPNLNALKTARFKTELGEVIISGKEDDVYTQETLEKTCLLIDLGGSNRYAGNPAGAKEGEIRIVIDFGENVTVTSTQNFVSAGAGVFGIGLFYLPNSSGTKNIHTQSYSQGFGLCGVGGLFAKGIGDFKADRYVQGTGGFGIGIFSNARGEGSRYSANLYGQGVGFTKGVGIFHHDGSSATLQGGLLDPDPREALGSTSLCQGVGFGPRAFAGGGAGFCVLKGDRLSLESSYFAQGAGYWHALGAFHLEGRGSMLKARRYDQGSGVHSAVGFFALQGNENRMVNWGVGPAFGWDRSIGWAFLFGDKNSARADWGSASAALSGCRSFLFFSGRDNTFELPGAGGGGYTREIADYGFSWIEGSGTRLKSPHFKRREGVTQELFTSPWGVLSFHDVILSSETALPKPDWEKLPQQEFVEREKVNLGQEIEEARQLPAGKKMEKLLAVASAFSVEKGRPREALANLVVLSEEELPALCRLLDPSDFDGFIQIRSALSEIGPAAGPALFREIRLAQGERRAWVLAQLPYLNAKIAMPELLRAAQDPDWRIRAMAIKGLGNMLSQDRGHESGRMQTLESLCVYLSSSNPDSGFEDELVRKLATRSYFESAALLSLAWDKTVSDRLQSFQHAPQELSGSFESEQAKALLRILQGKKETALKNFTDEMKESKPYEKQFRNLLDKELRESRFKQKELLPVILNALGNLGHPGDVPKIAAHLTDSSATVKEAAAAALGRIGEASLPRLLEMFKSGTQEEKIQALCSVGRAWDPKFLEILEMGFKNSDPRVQAAAVSMVPTLRYPFDKERDVLMNRLKTESLTREDPRIRLQTQYLYGN